MQIRRQWNRKREEKKVAMCEVIAAINEAGKAAEDEKNKEKKDKAE